MFVQFMPLGPKMALPRDRGHMFYIGLYRKNMKNLLVRDHKAKNLAIWYVALSSVPLPKLFKLCPWGQNWAPGVTFLI